MLYEQALAHWTLAQHLPDPNAQQTHAEAALKLFKTCEAQHEQILVEEFQAKLSS